MNENAKKWLTALRSGQYKQGRRWLNRNNEFCCLGVACEVYKQEHPTAPTHTDSGGVIHYNGHDAYLPPEVKEWLGLDTDSGRFDTCKEDGPGSLTDLNDEDGKTFTEIADFIESNPEGLFSR